MVNARSDLMNLIVQNMKNDISSSKPVHVNLALHCIANIGSMEMAEAFGPEVPKLIVSPSVNQTYLDFFQLKYWFSVKQVNLWNKALLSVS